MSERGRLFVGRVVGIVIVGLALALILAPVGSAQGGTITPTATVPFSGVVDGPPTGCTSPPPSSVSIDWGDSSTPSAGTYDATTDTVSGSHTYAAAGSYFGSVTFTGATNCNTTDFFMANVAPPPPQFTQCPPVYLNSGCQFLVTVTAGGTNIQQDVGQGPYEGAEDALIGVQNNSPDPIASIPFSTPGSALFSFDEDGLCNPGGPPVPSGCVVTAPGTASGTTCGPQSDICSFPPPAGEPAGYVEPGAVGNNQNGYEGPTSWFSDVSTDQSAGQVNFSPAIPPGGSTYFSLEEPPTLASLNAGSTPSSVGLSGTPTVTSSGASFAGLVNPNGSATTAYFQFGLDQRYSKLGASGPTYTQATPVQSVGGDFASHSVTATVSGLVPNALYHVRLVATNSRGTSVGSDVTFTTNLLPAPGRPSLGKTFNLKPVKGLVQIKLGGAWIPLTQVRQVPRKTDVDTLQGTVDLITASNKKHKTQSGSFSGSIFRLSQAARGASKGLASLKLVENAFKGAPSFAECKAKAGSAVAARSNKRVLQLLHASAHGRYSSVGAHSAATVRGTKWTMAERCDGTLTHAIKDTVVVADFRRHKKIVLHAGHSYLATGRK